MTQHFDTLSLQACGNCWRRSSGPQIVTSAVRIDVVLTVLRRRSLFLRESVCYEACALSELRYDGFQWLEAFDIFLLYRNFCHVDHDCTCDADATGVDVNENRFQTYCNNLRLATALLYHGDRLWEPLPLSREQYSTTCLLKQFGR